MAIETKATTENPTEMEPEEVPGEQVHTPNLTVKPELSIKKPGNRLQGQPTIEKEAPVLHHEPELEEESETEEALVETPVVSAPQKLIERQIAVAEHNRRIVNEKPDVEEPDELINLELPGPDESMVMQEAVDDEIPVVNEELEDYDILHEVEVPVVDNEVEVTDQALPEEPLYEEIPAQNEGHQGHDGDEQWTNNLTISSGESIEDDAASETEEIKEVLLTSDHKIMVPEAQAVPELNRIPLVAVPVQNDTVQGHVPRSKGKKKPKTNWKERLSQNPVVSEHPVAELHEREDAVKLKGMPSLPVDDSYKVEGQPIAEEGWKMNLIVDDILEGRLDRHDMPPLYNDYDLDNMQIESESYGRLRLWIVDLSYESLDCLILSCAVFWTLSRVFKMRRAMRRSKQYFRELSESKMKTEKASEERYKTSAIAIAKISESIDQPSSTDNKAFNELEIARLTKIIESQSQLTNEILKFIQDEIVWMEGE